VRGAGCLLLVLGGAVIAGACGGEDERRDSERFQVGSGAAAAVVVRPAEQSRPTVVFLHGWGAVDPRAYGPWVRHLVRRGSAVVLPRYQVSAVSLPALALPNAVRGVRAALERLPGESWVAAGHSAGGALAADLAASAQRLDLPPPRAVFAAYPGRGLAGLPLRLPVADPNGIPAGVEILTLAGARDSVVGSSVAKAIVRSATNVPPERRRFVLVSRADAADHLAPQRGDAAAREVFWPALDRLIARARRAG
jgi:acetyl esterase/lipase